MDGRTELQQIRDRIKSVIVRALELDTSPGEIGDEVPLFAPRAAQGLDLDSLAAIEILVGLSKEFQLSLDEVPRESMQSVATLSTLIAAEIDKTRAA
jgi:acyl carrier protein